MQLTVSDPDNVKEVLISGPCNAALFGDMILLTCTAVRPDPNAIFAGKPPSETAVVVARLIFPRESIRGVMEVIEKQLQMTIHPGGNA